MLTSTSPWILLPMTAQMLLTVVVLVQLGKAKVRAFHAGEIDKTRFGIDDDAWPDSVRQIGNNLRNQFEIPVLFYAACLSLYLLGAGGWLAVIAATAFVAFRCLHVAEHTRRNHVPRRRKLFIYSVVALLVLVVLTLIAIVRQLWVFHSQ